MSIGRLHPHLQHAIVNDLGWRELRPVQALTIDAVLDGANCVVLAPTAGGKTEAAVFPVLSQILTEQRAPVAALYVCPIRALLNNQEERLRHYGRMIGLDVFKWHGDVAAWAKAKFRREPAHLLMTTPESLEVMLISAKTDARALFAGLGTVIVDEVHAFAADDRGAHLAAILERLSAFCGRDLQRIGLSATVGNPQVIGRWMQGSSERPFRLVDPPRGEARRDLTIDWADDVGQAAHGIAKLGRGRKSLVFVESRSRAEKVAHALGGSGVEVFIHHSSVSRADRAQAEERFTSGNNVAIVATSTMELGIDVGDLDQVLQIDSPSSVASFLQRIGRTGRRPGTRSNCTFFCQSPETLLAAVAVCRLADRGFVEDVVPAERALHVLAHQILALSLQEGGVSRHRVLDFVGSASPFAGFRQERVDELVDTMVQRDILYEADGLLSLGRRGEVLYGAKNFFELYAVFSSPPVLEVLDGREEVGQVDAFFVQGHDPTHGALCFRLAGRAWQVVHADWNKGVLQVRPAAQGAVPTWLGMPGSMLSWALCQEMMAALIEEGPEAGWLTPAAARALDSLRQGYDGLLAKGTSALEDHGAEVQWHTFAGGRINRLLGAGLEDLTGARWTVGNLSLKCKDVGLVAARDGIRGLVGLDWEAVATAKAHDLARGRISKFQPCLPSEAEDRLLVERLLDVEGTLRFLGGTEVGGQRLVTGGARTIDAPLAELVAVPALAGPVATYALRNPVVWIADDEALAVAARGLLGEARLGLDVESTLDTQALCLVQIATPERTLVIDALAVGSLEPLRALFEDARIVKVIHDARFERRVLGNHGFELAGVFDTLVASRALHGKDAMGGHSLAMVCERELGAGLDKTLQRSNWARRPLSPEQIAYAAADAEVLLPLHDRLARSVGSLPVVWRGHAAPDGET